MTWSGVPVNEDLPAPRSPGPWVDPEQCEACGARYRDFRAGIDWSDGVALVRGHNGEGGGYRSRGPVLWAMRVLKLDAWYMEHWCCGEAWHAARSSTRSAEAAVPF